MGYNPEKIIILDKESFVEEKIKKVKGVIKKFFNRETTKEEEQKARYNYGNDYDKLISNKYDVGYLLPQLVKVKNVVLYEGDFCFIDEKNTLYYIAD